MRAPHFFRLAEIDERRFINACRHGLVHLTWNRLTIRLSRDELRQLAGLLARSADALSPGTARDGRMQVTCSIDGDCELQLDSLRLALSPEDFRALGDAVHEAVKQLDEILEAGFWDEAVPEDVQPSIIELLHRHRFSEN